MTVNPNVVDVYIR